MQFWTIRDSEARSRTIEDNFEVDDALGTIRGEAKFKVNSKCVGIPTLICTVTRRNHLLT